MKKLRILRKRTATKKEKSIVVEETIPVAEEITKIEEIHIKQDAPSVAPPITSPYQNEEWDKRAHDKAREEWLKTNQ